MYNNLNKNESIIQDMNPRFVMNFINGPYLEINNSLGNTFNVSFIDKKSGNVYYNSEVGNNCWCRSNISYFIDWKIIARRDDGEVFEFDYDPNGKKVFIVLESSSIGDTLAWFPYIDEFRKKWNCEVICSTFHNNLFIEKYPELEFVSPGYIAHGIYAMYRIGWFYDENGNHNHSLNPSDFKNKSLQQTASDILGLEFEHIRANIGPNRVEIEKKKRVGIGFHSTAQTKYWNNPTGWQEVVDYLNFNGYEVMILSRENDGYMGNFYPNGVVKLTEGSIENLIDVMLSCEFFIGIGSGLSWLAWTLNIPTVLISGFSTPVSEFEGDGVIRIFNDSVCNGCYNRYRFNAGDWNWCPDHKETERQFECTKSITGKMVIDELVKSELVKSEFKFDNREKLGELLNKLKLTNKGVEIGTFKGEFSKKILEDWSGKLYMVDVWRQLDDYDDMSNNKYYQTAFNDASNNIKGFEDRAFMMRMDSSSASELFTDETLDFVYIDANHTYDYVKEDIKNWYPKVKSGGLIMGHDYIPDNLYQNGDKDIPLYLFTGDGQDSKYAGMFGVNTAVDEFVKENDYELFKTDEFLATWYIYKK